MIVLNEILFLFFAFLTVFLSIKLSYYADSLSNNSKVSKALIGGIVLAGVTSLPEFVTCFSAIFVDNPALAMGDILGSNLFNIFMICFFDVIFMKKMIFTCASKSHNLVLLLLLINYLILFFVVGGLFSFSFFSLGIPSVVIMITYLLYIKSIPKYNEEKVVINNFFDNHLTLKLIVTAVFMIFSSVILTVIVNNLSLLYPSFSSSFLGAIFLGITTSLPEVITFYTLVNINNYDLALSNIVGSNLFNLLVLSIGDIFVRNFSIYSFADNDTIFLIGFGLLFTLFCFISNNRKNVDFGFSYSFFSVLVIILYLGFWIVKFL